MSEVLFCNLNYQYVFCCLFSITLALSACVTDLPCYILLEIFSYLDIFDLLQNVSFVCSKFNSVVPESSKIELHFNEDSLHHVLNHGSELIEFEIPLAQFGMESCKIDSIFLHRLDSQKMTSLDLTICQTILQFAKLENFEHCRMSTFLWHRSSCSSILPKTHIFGTWLDQFYSDCSDRCYYFTEIFENSWSCRCAFLCSRYRTNADFNAHTGTDFDICHGFLSAHKQTHVREGIRLFNWCILSMLQCNYVFTMSVHDIVFKCILC